jgi:hypothetical protein
MEFFEAPDLQPDVQFMSRAISERAVSATPKALLVGAAFSIGLSLVLRSLGRKDDALFVGEWAPTLLLLGLYSEKLAEKRGAEKIVMTM